MLVPNPQDEYLGQTTVLSADQAEVLEREARSDAFGVAHLVTLAKQGEPIAKGLAYAVLSVRESRLAEFTKIFGIELDSATARADRFAALRAANIRVAQLEHQLGAAVPVDALQLALRSMEEQLRGWWRALGLGHVAEVSFGGYGARMKLSCGLSSRRPWAGSDTPATDRQAHAEWVAALREKGFHLVPAPVNKCAVVLADCEINQQLLCSLVRSALPSAQFEGSRSVYFGTETTGRAPVLRDVTFFVPELQDIAALPAPSTY